jgi:hypothetical protein
MEYWNIGMMEWWVDGSPTPVFRYTALCPTSARRDCAKPLYGSWNGTSML